MVTVYNIHKFGSLTLAGDKISETTNATACTRVRQYIWYVRASLDCNSSMECYPLQAENLRTYLEAPYSSSSALYQCDETGPFLRRQAQKGDIGIRSRVVGSKENRLDKACKRCSLPRSGVHRRG